MIFIVALQRRSVGSNMPFNLSSRDLDQAIEEAHDGYDLLHRTVGLYFSSFGAAELQLTRLLAHVINLRNFEQFDFLAKNMDVRTKCERLREAAKLYSPMGQNIESRIKLFEKRLRKVRNDLAHSELTIDNNNIVCSSMSKFRYPVSVNVRPSGLPPTKYTVREIQILSLWLRDFYYDLDECANRTWNGQSFDIPNPRSTLP